MEGDTARSLSRTELLSGLSEQRVLWVVSEQMDRFTGSEDPRAGETALLLS